MLQVQYRMSTTSGKGVGRWLNYFRAEDMTEARWAIGHLVPSALVRIKDGKTEVMSSRRAGEVR